MNKRFLAALMVLVAGSAASLAGAGDPNPAPLTPAAPPEPPKVDLAKQPTLYVVGYAHLDTQWRWAYPQTIREYIPNTLRDNFRLIEKHPTYIFNFSGSRRYQMMEEYYPADYAKLKEYVAAGRWFPCGSSVDENDANTPNAESYCRHVMYGNRYFRREFGTASEEFMLPDCFGFPAALPSLLAHCGLKGFSTQKLTWGLAIGQIPFKVGVWEGPDGRSIVAALDPGSYVGEVKENLATNEGWSKRIDNNGAKSGVFTDYHYYGTGDQGGAPKATSVAMVEQSVNTDGHTKVISAAADWMFKAITPEMAAKLPKYKGELELTEHTAGSVTSQAYMKRWNRKNEQLAQAAETAAVGAWWAMGNAPGTYPAQRLEDAWCLVLGSQMHDILPGTSIPKAYEYSWNDEVIASNVFADVAASSVGALSDGMDTRAQGASVVLYNPLATERADVVEFTIPLPDGDAVGGIDAVGPTGESVPAQIVERLPGSVRVAMAPRLPSAGVAVFDLRPVKAAAPAGASLKVTPNSMENERYTVKLDARGDVSSVFDKTLKKEMLTAPVRLGLHYENPRNWPAWNQDWADRQQPARGYVGEEGTPKITVVESGPVRGALRVERELDGSVFVQEIRLAAGDAGDTLSFHNVVDWNSKERSLRAAFPLAAANPNATFDIQTGVIERPNSNAKLFEYPAHTWMDLTDASGSFGASVLNDSKYGCDKPDNSTLRLTLLHTPGTRGGYRDQGTQDLGRHEIDYALFPHASDWRAGTTAWAAARFNQPVRAFIVPKHEGPLGKQVSLVRCDNPNVMVTAVKKAEDSDEIVVRLRELTGTGTQARVTFPAAASAAREIDGQERPIAAAKVDGGSLVADVHGYGLRAFAVSLVQNLGRTPCRPPESAPVALAYDADVASTNSMRDDGEMDPGRAFPAEQLPAQTSINGVTFRFGPTADGQKNAVTCKGQEVALPGPDFTRVEFLAAAAETDTPAAFQAGGRSFNFNIQKWRGYVGQWDNRRWAGEVSETNERSYRTMTGLDPGYIKPEAIAWFASHHHTSTGDEFYKYAYLFRYAIDLPKGSTSVKLPDAPGVRIMAMTAVRSAQPRAAAAAPMLDTLDGRFGGGVRITASGRPNDSVLVKVQPSLYWHEGGVRYTLDGSDPTPASPQYTAPFWLGKPATVKAAAFDYAGKPGRIASHEIRVEDRTPPSIKNVTTTYESAVVRLEFSEPVDRTSGTLKTNYTVSGAPVAGVDLAPDALSAVITLNRALTPDQPAVLKIAGVKDTSAAANAFTPTASELVVRGPAYRLETVAAGEGQPKPVKVEGVKRLPTRGNQPWTINMWIKPDKQPVNRTLFGGFGRCEQTAGGNGRYLGKFGTGIHFWSHNADVVTREPLTIGEWQMLTATSDGSVIRIYKNAKKIAEQPSALSDDEPVVHALPIEPWEHKYQFDGGFRDFTVWDSCLTEESLKTLKSAFKEP